MRAEYEERRRPLGDRTIESLVDLPMMADPEMRAVMKLFSALGQLAYHADGDLYQMISCWMVKLSCRHGTSEYSTIGYGAIAVVLGPVFHRFADGEAFARLAVAVAERYGFTSQKAGAHFLMQLQRHVLLGNAERAVEFAAKAKPILWSARLNLQSIDYCFYHSLAIAAVFEAASPERRAELRENLIEHLASFQRWAESCPATFAHKHALVSAEWARLEGRDIEAMQLYEQAIRSASERGFLQDRALAGELAARFYRLRGLDKVADTYLEPPPDR